MTLAVGSTKENFRFDPCEQDYVPELIDGITLLGETHTVVSLPKITKPGSPAKYGFKLNELPYKESPSSVMIKKISAPLSVWTEVVVGPGQYPAAGEFFVDYHRNINSNTGWVLLPASEVGEAFYVTYKGLGSVSSYENISTIVFPTGIIIMGAEGTPPGGFLPCDGASLLAASYPDLFALIGYTFGGAGANFNVPDFRGRAPIGDGTGTGLSLRTIGDMVGEEAHVLSWNEMPSHGHGVSDPSHAHSSVFGHGTGGAGGTGGFMVDAGYNFSHGTTGAGTGISIGAAGADQPHENMQPSLAIAFFIKY